VCFSALQHCGRTREEAVLFCGLGVVRGTRFFVRSETEFFLNDRKKLSHFGQNVRKHRLVIIVTASSNTTTRQITEKSQRKVKQRGTTIFRWTTSNYDSASAHQAYARPRNVALFTSATYLCLYFITVIVLAQSNRMLFLLPPTKPRSCSFIHLRSPRYCQGCGDGAQGILDSRNRSQNIFDGRSGA